MFPNEWRCLKTQFVMTLDEVSDRLDDHIMDTWSTGLQYAACCNPGNTCKQKKQFIVLLNGTKEHVDFKYIMYKAIKIKHL